MNGDSPFERAADALVNGDISALRQLLRQDPGLVRARSAREHPSTLLHYVSANGVEDERQKTPSNVVEIAKLLLDSGADVNAESDSYGGGSTALLLTATSVHPERAGVQLALMQLLLDYGARIDLPNGASAVTSCLRNGRGAAAEFLAGRGARLDLEAAAGVGRLDLVEGFFDQEGLLKSPATREQMEDGFAWACQFGRTQVADFLLSKGLQVDTKLKHHGQTGLHWAALGAHAETVRLLMSRGAALDARDDTFHSTPLEWAIYGRHEAEKHRTP